jgi:flagellar motor protein MotB
MSDKPIIVIKKRGKKQQHEAHGGSWKIAYADFVTAMMAFFLLMWLINATNEEQRKGIADYFAPNLINMRTQNGSAGLMGGVNMSNPNNSSGKSSEERSKSTEIEVDVSKSTQLEAFQDKKDVSNDALAAKRIKVDATNTEKIKKNDAVSFSEKATSTVTKEEAVVSQLKEKKERSSKDKEKKVAAKVESVKAEAEKMDPANVESTKKEQSVKKEQGKADIAKANSANTGSTAAESAKVGSIMKEQGKAESAKPESANGGVSNAGSSKAESLKKDQGQAGASQSDLNKVGLQKPDQEMVNATIVKIVRVDLEENKKAKDQVVQKEAAEKALSQVMSAVKKNQAETTYERSISNAISDKKMEQQKALEKAMNESKERAEAIKNLQRVENDKLTKIAESIKEIIQNNPELKGLLSHVVIEDRPEGLRIQLIDKDKRSMFASGSSSMTPQTKQLMKAVATMIENLPNSLVISGHTDAHPYVGTRKYSNWELSADRANATRRVLQEYNVNANRFESVMGKEATDPFVKEDPFNESNRRISITLLRQYGMPSPEVFKQITGGR